MDWQLRMLWMDFTDLRQTYIDHALFHLPFITSFFLESTYPGKDFDKCFGNHVFSFLHMVHIPHSDTHENRGIGFIQNPLRVPVFSFDSLQYAVQVHISMNIDA